MKQPSAISHQQSEPDRPATFLEAGQPLSSLPAANHACAWFNKDYPLGTPVIYWPLGFRSPARIAKTRDLARARQVKEGDGRSNHRTAPEFVAELYVDGCGGPVSLGFVAVIMPANLRGCLRLEFTADVVLDLECGGPHVLPNMHAAIKKATAPLQEALSLALESR